MHLSPLFSRLTLGIALGLASAAQAADGGSDAAAVGAAGDPDDGDRHPRAANLEQVTVTARRIKGDALSYPGAVSVLSTEVIEREQVGSMVDLLNLVPGFNLDYDLGRDIGRNFTLRGFGFADDDRIIVKVDGARRSFNFANQISTFSVDPDLLREVEVVRGSSSVVHGGGAFGGVVEMRTKDARDLLRGAERFGARVRLGWNHNNRQHGSAQLFGTNATRDFDYLLSLGFTEAGDHKLAGGQVVENDSSKRDGMLKLRYAPAPAHELHLKLQRSRQHVQNPWNTLWHLSEWADTVITGVHTQDDITASWTYDPASPWVRLAVDAFHNRTEYDRKVHDLQLIGQPDEYTGLIDRNRYGGINAQNIATFDTGAVHHVLQAGVDLTWRKEDQFDKYTRAYALLAAAEARDYGLYLQDNLSFGRRSQWDLLLAARYDRFEREAGRLSNPLPQESTETYRSQRWSPRLGLGWQATGVLRLFANYSEVFRAPSAFELYATGAGNPWTFWVPNLGLKAETGKEWEAGFALDLSQATGLDALLFKVNAFKGDFSDFISLVDIDPRPSVPGDTGPGGTLRGRLNQYRNLDAVERRGVEVEGSLRQGDWNGELVYSRLRVRDAHTRLDVPHAFADKLLLSAGYHIAPIGVDLGWRMNWYFAAPNNPPANAAGQPLIDRSFKTHDAFVSWRPAADEALRISGGVRNVFDQSVVTPGRPANSAQLGIGRSVFADISYQF
ncbi:TonB-dependent receptor domain-containing protein [Stenotrophomonas mori]|uniref:TonB-dependent receptor n=1 Tax=Stenotrophomonas mori TaxID=2871096 RepID=A0ABT0SGT6_9GAMM|nr:TonB-dependent receptor [Stenotrophomonas mori]MCL7714527.1 TonB-dependent receptor [Stenotrophomonas mori]